MKATTILIGSPIRQDPDILKVFLERLSALDTSGLRCSFRFIDDNVDQASSNLLERFQRTARRTHVVPAKSDVKADYIKTDTTHIWTEELIWKVAGMKDELIRQALKMNVDYLFLVDSDLILHPRTLRQLLAAKKDIVSNIFWTQWQKDAPEAPQVWLRDMYTQHHQQRGEYLDPEEIKLRREAFFETLRTPGVHEVGGLGACTLISRQAMKAGVKFAEIPNLSFPGEDRHFCIRARALGFPLFVDTHYPALHLYHRADLDKVAAFIREDQPAETAGASLYAKSDARTISLCMIVRNEEQALPHSLGSVADIVDEIIVVDTGSTDRTIDIAKSYGAKVFSFTWIDDFAAARNYSFSKATQTFIMWLDADDRLLPEDRQRLAELKKNLDLSVDSYTMPYHLQTDKDGKVISSLRRNRLVRRDRGFRWIGPVHEYLQVGGQIRHSDVAITHQKEKAYTDRNLRIYRNREQKGEQFSPRDLYYFGNELKDHLHYEEAVVKYEAFLDGGKGWVEDNIQACQKMATCYYQLGMREEALRALFRSFFYDVPRAAVCCQIGAMHVDYGDYRAAISWYERAAACKEAQTQMAMVDHSASTWLPHLQLCVCYDKLGMRSKALYHHEQAKKFNPDHPSVQYNDGYFQRTAFSEQA